MGTDEDWQKAGRNSADVLLNGRGEIPSPVSIRHVHSLLLLIKLPSARQQEDVGDPVLPPVVR